jgi:hypothetical protein
MLEHSLLVEALDYNPQTGDFIWKKKIAKKTVVGKRAGSITPGPNGYLPIRVFGKIFYQHRLAWFYVHGKWPDGEIDHINHDKTDNRLINLRDVSRQENCLNAPLRPNNTSGHCGVLFDKAKGKWLARIDFNRSSRYLGCYDTKEEAVIARKAAEKMLGFHEGHGQDSSNNGDMLRSKHPVVRGISRDLDKWRAGIRLNGVVVHLGLFDTYEEAVKAKEDAEDRYVTGASNNGIVEPPPAKPPKSATGIEGVGFDANAGKWRVRIKDPTSGKWKSVGYFSEFEDAVAVRKQAEAELAQGIMPTAVRTSSDRRKGSRPERIPSCLQA